MSIQFILQPSILMETVELLYQFANNITLDNVRRDFLPKYRDYFTPEDQSYYQIVFQALDEVIAEGTRGLNREDPRLQHYFRKIITGSAGQGTCLAKVILFSFYFSRGHGYTLEEELQECKDRYQTFSAENFSRFRIVGIDSNGLVIDDAEAGKPVSLLRQVELLDLPGEIKWDIYLALMEYSNMLQDLEALMSPVASQVEHALAQQVELSEQVLHYWQGYFDKHSFQDFKQTVMGVEFQPTKEGRDEVHFWWMGSTQLRFYQEHDRETLNIGILLRGDMGPKSGGYVQENVLSILKLLSDRSKYEIIRNLSGKSCYGQELAGEMQLTPGTISKHLNALFSSGLLNLRRVNNRVYYQTDKAAVNRFLDQLAEGLLGRESAENKDIP